MWANYYDDGWCNTFNYEADAKAFASPHSTHTAIPVAVIPLDDIQGIEDRMCEAFSGSYDGHLAKDDITAMLTAIGVLPKQRKKGRK